MKTIKDELEKIAKQCITSEEFTKRAHNYLTIEKKIHEPLMKDAELRDIYRNVAHKREVEKAWEKYDNTILPILKKREDCKGLWYETWIDLNEEWEDKWFSAFKFLTDNQIVEACAKYLNEQERYYHSADHYDMLDRMYESIREEEKIKC
jgi:hypothetical protein